MEQLHFKRIRTMNLMNSKNIKCKYEACCHCCNLAFDNVGYTMKKWTNRGWKGSSIEEKLQRRACQEDDNMTTQHTFEKKFPISWTGLVCIHRLLFACVDFGM